LGPPDIRKVFAVPALALERAVKEEVDDAHGNVINDLSSLGKVGKPATVRISLQREEGCLPGNDLCRRASYSKKA
jgi:hypothetical protein